jgi:putative heme iron utilization protein
MDVRVGEAIRSLLATEQVLTAAVLVEGGPVAALLPFAPSADWTAVYVQASRLARHARGLGPGARVSVLVHAPATPDRDPMQLPRLTVEATVTVLERGAPAFAAAAESLRARFPIVATTLTLEDFHLYALTLGRGRYVEGFARAFNVGPDTFRELGSPPA